MCAHFESHVRNHQSAAPYSQLTPPTAGHHQLPSPVLIPSPASSFPLTSAAVSHPPQPPQTRSTPCNRPGTLPGTCGQSTPASDPTIPARLSPNRSYLQKFPSVLPPSLYSSSSATKKQRRNRRQHKPPPTSDDIPVSIFASTPCS